MEGVTSIALTEKVLSRCHLLHTEMVLLETPAGLSLKWICDSGDGEHRIYSSQVTSYKVILVIAIGGNIKEFFLFNDE